MKPVYRSWVLAALVLVSLALGLVGAAPPAQAQDRDVTQRMLRASVKLLTPFDADEDAGSLCSGSMLDEEGYILTNFHCIGYPTDGQGDEELESLGLEPGDLFNEKGLSVVALTDDPRRLPKPAYVAQALSWDSDLDIAVLKIIANYNSKQKIGETLPVVTMPLADSDSVQTLDDVIVVGYPGIAGDTVTATEGRISGFLDQDGDDVFDWFKTDVLVNQGNSGGAALNTNGELIGVPTARLQDRQGNVIYLIRPTNRAVPYIEAAKRVGASGGQVVNPPSNSSNPPARPSGRGSFGEIVFGAGFDDNSGVTGEADAFPSGIDEVHAGLPYENMRDGTDWGYTWQYEGQDVTGEPELEWEFGDSGVLDLSLSGRRGLTDGNYNLQVFLRGDLVQEAGFTVGDDPGGTRPPQPPPAGDDGVKIVGAIIDQATKRPINNAVIAVLFPGLTSDDFDADQTENKEESVYAYGVTGGDGVFVLNRTLERGEVYSVIVGAKGYQRIAEDDALEIFEDDPDVLELDPIEMDRQ
ncbi:MAG: serine protease [Anaerolineae bacterium]|jgi:S1-C subfamily serine protease|nr:serine protease [Anaerolineae bacterium]